MTYKPVPIVKTINVSARNIGTAQYLSSAYTAQKTTPVKSVELPTYPSVIAKVLNKVVTVSLPQQASSGNTQNNSNLINIFQPDIRLTTDGYGPLSTPSMFDGLAIIWRSRKIAYGGVHFGSRCIASQGFLN